MQEIVYTFYLFTLFVLVWAQSNEICTRCIKKEQCSLLANMNPTDQNTWINKYSCNVIYNGYYMPSNKGSYVCCSDSLYDEFIRRYGVHNGNNYPGDTNGLDPEYTTRPYTTHLVPTTILPRTTAPPVYYPPSWTSHPSEPSGPNVNVLPGITHLPSGIDITTPTPTPGQPYYPSRPVHIGGRSQCPISSFPPNPASGCCGFEASDAERISATTTARPTYQTPPNPYYPQNTPTNLDLGIRNVRDTNEQPNPANVTINNRIAGGSETDFFQFPWTVQLITTFDYGQRRQSFDCGASLISSRYVLTAGHCVYDSTGTLIKVEAYLAEYDRTTFPDDCKHVGPGTQCIHNVVIEGEEVTRHPQYDDDKLSNDIALIRLREDAPYSPYIRPICLAPIDLDDAKFANLRLAVAGWGRNGRYRSNIKQSTVVNLVPQEQCKKYYPTLLRSQMCAVGYSGEDTCKGDSGGPLMTVNGQKYYVVGVVSGKRADAPCGTSVPSLYTNVYQYLDWIFSNIRS